MNGAKAQNLITSDDITRNGLKWAPADAIPRISPGRAILINSDTQDGPGEHWIAVYRARSGHIFLYDPLGPKNKISNGQLIVGALGREGAPIHVYPARNQGDKSNLCGWLSILAAKIMQRHDGDPFGAIRARIRGDGTDEVLAAFGERRRV